MSRLNAHDSLHHDLECDVRYPRCWLGWDDCFHFSHFTPALYSLLSMSQMYSRWSDTAPATFFSSSLCLLSGPGQVLSPHLNKHSAYIWWSNNWNISTLLTEFTETQLRLFWLILLRTAALWLLITGRSFLAFRMTQSHRCRGSQSLKALLTWCMVYHVSLQSIWNEGMFEHQSYVKLGRDVQLMTSSFQLAGCGRQRALCGLESVEPAGVLH